jgi:adenylate cyclase
LNTNSQSEAIEIITRFSIEPIIAKTRHEVPYEGAVWHADVFEGANTGLVVAEVELEYERAEDRDAAVGRRGSDR